MANSRGEHSHRFRPLRRAAAGVLASSLLGFGLSGAFAADPPQPDFFWPYGRVQLDGANIEPAQQTVVALVDGVACGEATAFVAEPGPGVPAEDEDRTVYVINVLADGNGTGQRPGCGIPGDPVLLYFAGSHRVALQQPQFQPGGLRVDVELGPELTFRLPLPLLASEP